MPKPDPSSEAPSQERRAQPLRLRGPLQIALVIGVLAAGVLANRILSNTVTAPEIRATGSGEVTVRVVVPDVGDTQVRLQETGIVQVRNAIELSPQVSGRVVWVNPALASGGAFRKGELLFRLDDADYQAAIDRARADLAVRQADLQVEQAEGDIARREWALVNPGEPIPSTVAREPQLARALAAVRSSEIALADAERNLTRARFTLPFDGRVLASAVEVGQNLLAGQSYGRAYEDGGIEVSVPVHAAVLDGLSPAVGREALVRPRQMLMAQRRVAYAATVTRADAELDPQTRLARLTLAFAERSPLLPGDFVDIEISGPLIPGAYRFPVGALQENRSLWVVTGGRLARRYPQLVFVDERDVSALPFDSGDGIVVSPLDSPKEGDPVRIAGEPRVDRATP